MRYKEFVKWCNDRATDGCWDMQTAMLCSGIIKDIQTIKWWNRNKYWKQHYEDEVVEVIVTPINKKRETWLGR